MLSEQLCAMLPRLRRFARALAGNAQDADDLVQTALERALARASQWQKEHGVEGWIFGIVRHAWVDELRSRQRRQRVFAPAEAAEDVAVAIVERPDTARSVQGAMAKLPASQRIVVALVLVEGLSYKEAAAALDVPIGTVMSRLARGRASLQRMLGDQREDQ